MPGAFLLTLAACPRLGWPCADREVNDSMQVAATLKAAGDSHPGLQRSNQRGSLSLRSPLAASSRRRRRRRPGGRREGGRDGARHACARGSSARPATIEDRVREAITLANNEIHRLASIQSGVAGDGVRAHRRGRDQRRRSSSGHVGDTRLYKLRGGRIEKLTRDHSPVGEREDAGELSEREAMQHPRRNEVYRDVGSEPHDPDDPHFIDVFRQPFEPDAALLLCSDGLTDAVPAAVLVERRERLRRSSTRDRPGAYRRSERRRRQGQRHRRVRGGAAVRGRGGHARPSRSGDSNGAAIDPAGAGPVATGSGEAASVKRRAKGRWRLVTLVVLLVAVSGMAAYMQRDRLRLPDLGKLWPLANPQPEVAQERSWFGSIPRSRLPPRLPRASAGAEVVGRTGRVPRATSAEGGCARDEPGAPWSVVAAAERRVRDRCGGDRLRRHWRGAVRLSYPGDAATPLGAGIVVRNSTVSLTDLEISGARNAAIEYAGSGGGSVVGVDLHDNPGAALVVRDGASPRIAHNSFARNATLGARAGYARSSRLTHVRRSAPTRFTA